MWTIIICGILIGMVSSWNYFVLKDHETIIGAMLLNPLPAYISGAFRNFGILAFLLYIAICVEFLIALYLFISIAMGSFLGGMLFRALYPVTYVIGILSIIPTIACMAIIVF